MKFEELIKLAIESEENSYNFYMEAMNIVKYPNVLELLKMLANEELEHKKLLQNISQGKNANYEKYLDLKLSDHLPLKDEIGEDSTLQDIFKVAISREKKEYNFYSELIKKVEDENLVKTLKFIAEQEINHKAKLENLYDELFYKEF